MRPRWISISNTGLLGLPRLVSHLFFRQRRADKGGLKERGTWLGQAGYTTSTAGVSCVNLISEAGTISDSCSFGDHV